MSHLYGFILSRIVKDEYTKEDKMKIIEFKNVKKYFKKREIIKNLSFSINKNEVVGLIGTNGAGKTTTIRMILA